MLRDLTIQNYRCFKDFNIDGLKQVNLFVGNNNSGKTSLLEAIYLLVDDNPKLAVVDVLLLRREALECIYNQDYRKNSRIVSHVESIRHIFYDRTLEENHNISIKSKNSGSDNKSILININNRALEFHKDCSNADETCKDKSIALNADNSLNLSDFNLMYAPTLDNKYYISSNRETTDYLVGIWDNIYLTEKEQKVVQSLKLLKPNTERIGFFQSEQYNIVRIKFSDLEYPIPISSMGEGMYRILTLAMSLVASENGVLLVDEIETGLHYEAQTDMWRLILETAKELNVQVFATTHSWDCIAAYQEALSQVEDSSIGKLFRLDSKYGKLRAVEYDADDLDIAVRKGIEVR